MSHLLYLAQTLQNAKPNILRVIKLQQTILIIDDEEELCLLLSYALGRLGYQIEYALTLKDGMIKLEEYEPEIVLLDINLPDGSGLDMIPKLRNLKVDFLVISAYDDKREQALRQGASGFLKKPFDLKSITSRIADIT